MADKAAPATAPFLALAVSRRAPSDLLGLAPAEVRQLFKPRPKFQGLHGDVLRINAYSPPLDKNSVSTFNVDRAKFLVTHGFTVIEMFTFVSTRWFERR